MEEAGGLAHAGVGVAGVEDGGLELLAGGEGVGEVEGVEASGDADLLELVLLEGDAPGAAPGEGSEPDVAGLLGGGAAADGEPGVVLVAGGAATAFEDGLAGLDGLGVEGELAGPATAEVVHGVVGSAGEVPAGGGGLLDGEAGLGAVFDGGGAAEDAGVSVHAVAEGDEDVAEDVAEDDGEGVVGDLVGDVVEDEVAVAVGEGDLEGGLDV